MEFDAAATAPPSRSIQHPSQRTLTDAYKRNVVVTGLRQRLQRRTSQAMMARQTITVHPP